MPNQKKRFTQRARRALAFAQEEAERMQHGYIGTEHLLIGLARDDDGIAARVLHDLGLVPVRVADLAEQMTHAGKRAWNTMLEIGPDTEKVLELANDAAHRMNHEFIGTEHLLLGLISHDGGTGIEIFKRLNVSLEEVEKATRKALGGS